MLDKIIVRLPDGLRDRLGELAQINGRSANAEAVKALEAWLLPDPQKEPAFVRLTDELWHKLGRAAKRNKRGIVDEIIDRLAGTFSDPPRYNLSESDLDLRAEISTAVHDAMESLLSNPEKLRRIGRTPPGRDDDDGPVNR